MVQSVWKHIENATERAAKGTGTQVTWELLGGVYETLAEVIHKNLKTVGELTYTPEEIAFARKISETFGEQKVPVTNAALVRDFRDASESATSDGSTDVGDVSWTVPTVGLQNGYVGIRIVGP